MPFVTSKSFLWVMGQYNTFVIASGTFLNTKGWKQSYSLLRLKESTCIKYSNIFGFTFIVGPDRNGEY